MTLSWWKITGIILVAYTLVSGLLIQVPALPILHESIRNLFFHVTMWFAMIIIMLVSVIYGIRYLLKPGVHNDFVSAEAANVGVFLGILGVATGSLWAKNTWGAWWTNDAKLNGAAISLLFYFAYIILRQSVRDEEKRGRLSAIYNIFSFIMMMLFIIILPRTTDSLHPGNGGNPGFDAYDLDANMRKVFYPAIIGWTLLAVWILNLRVRIAKLEQQIT